MVAERLRPEQLAVPSALDTCAQWFIGILLVFAPLAFGTTQAWCQEIMFVLVGAATFCVLLKWTRDRSATLVWTWAYVPMVLFVLLCVAQVIALPAGLLEKLSPGTIGLKRDLLADLPNAAALLQRATISFYPTGSLTELRLLLAVIAMFFVVINVYRDPIRIRRLLLIIACAGMAVALLAVYQNVSGTESVYGLVPALHRNAGPFMNYSHFGQFMNLSVGAAMGLLFVKWADFSQRGDGVGPLLEEIREFRSWSSWLLVALCVIGPITVFLSMTRMGMLSLMVAGAMLAVMVAWRGRKEGRGTLVFALGVIVFAALLCVGFDAIYSRLATVRHVQSADGGRMQMLKDIWIAVSHFPVLGAGLGTHEFIFPMFDRSKIAQLATHAENEYAQLLEECGIIGLALAGAFLAMVAINYAKTIWRPKNAIQYAGFGIGFGVMAILIHSGSDFGQHVPANALLMATFCALLFTLATRPWVLARSLSTDDRAVAPIEIKSVGTMGLAMRGLALIAVTAGCVMILTVADTARRAEGQWGRAQAIADSLQAAQWRGSDAEFVNLLKHASAAAKLEPRDITYQYGLNVYRWRTISRDVDPTTHNLVLTSASVPFVSRIVDELETARPLCPSFGPVLSLAGALKLEVLKQPAGAGEIQLGFRLTPYDTMACLGAGQLALRQHDWPAAQIALSRFVALGGPSREAIDLFLRTGKPELAYEIARGNRRDLQQLASDLRSDATQAALIQKCKDEASVLLAAEASAPGAPADVLADLAASYQAAGNKTGAIEFYQRALNLEYGQVSWRLELARLFAEAGRPADAAREARVCLRIRPQSSEARTMLASYVRDSAADSESVVHP